jgi:hypothetical protein
MSRVTPGNESAIIEYDTGSELKKNGRPELSKQGRPSVAFYCIRFFGFLSLWPDKGDHPRAGIAANANFSAVIAGDKPDLAARYRHHIPDMTAAPAPQNGNIAWTRV